jgi:hypothetical protein
MFVWVNNVKDVVLSSVRLDRCLFEMECVCACVNKCRGGLGS